MISSSKAAAKALKKRVRDKIGEVFDINTYLFKEQLDFVNDPSPNKIAVCSRRAGKTTACAVHLVDTAIRNHGVVCLYITLSRNNAKKIIWKEILNINRIYKLGGNDNVSELSLTFPNGSIIYLSGAKDTNEIEKFRGLAIKLVYIDEAQSFREYIRQLIDDILAPALMDYAGTLCLIGTPGAIAVGYFAECSGAIKELAARARGWSKHHWTFWDNPFIIKKSKLSHQAMLDRELNRRGITSSDPSIQREWFGRWINDTNSLILTYNADKNHYIEIPKLPNVEKYNYIMGVDLGFDDADAISILAWSEHSPVTYLVEEVVTPKQDITSLVEQIQVLIKEYDVAKIVMDTGGLGKKIAEEITRRKHIPVEAADKKLKMQNFAFLNDALRTGNFKAKSGGKFAQDCFLVEIDWDKTTPDKIVLSKRYHSDIVDSVLYAFKYSPAYTFQATDTKPKYGTKEWADSEVDRMFEEAQRHFKEQADLEKRIAGLGYPEE